jgi:serine/threonine-protein kinase
MQRVGNYEVLEKLGQGPLGEVYKARREGADGFVALKLIPPAVVTKELISRFSSETKVVRKIEHENIARTIELGSDAALKCYYCAAEFIDGETVLQKVARDGAFAEDEAVRVALGVARALERARESELVHNDIGPAHVMLAADGTVKVLDLGIALAVGEKNTHHFTGEGEAAGSPHYASPEQSAAQSDTDIRSDLYSLGALMYFMVTGKPPFEGGTLPVILAGHMTGTVPWPSQVNPSLSEGFSRVVAKLMAKDPAERYKTPAGAVTDLELVVEGRGPELARKLPSASTIEVPATVKSQPIRAKGKTKPPTRGRLQKAPPRDGGGLSTEMKLAVGGVGVLVVGVVVLLGVIASGGDPPPEGVPAETYSAPARAPAPGPEAAPPRAGAGERRAHEMLSVARKFAGENPDRFAQARGYLMKAREAGMGTPVEADADAAVRRLEKRWDSAARKALAKALEKARDLVAAGDFDGALAALADVPEGLAPRVAERVQEESVLIESAGRSAIASVIAEAEALVAGGDATAVRTQLAKVAGVKFAAGVAEAADAMRAVEVRMTGHVEAGKLEAAREQGEKIAAVVAAFEALVAKGDYTGALKRMERESVSTDDEGLAEVVKAAARVAMSLEERADSIRETAEALVGRRVSLATKSGPKRGEVVAVADKGFDLTTKMIINRKVMGETRFTVAWSDLAASQLTELASSWEPKNAAEHVAAAYVALWAGDSSGAADALGSAAGHPLEAGLRRRLDVLKLGAAEAAAKGAWEEFAKGASGRAFPEEQAKKLLEEMGIFERDHGGTDFARSAAGQIAEVRSRLEEAASLGARSRKGLVAYYTFTEGKGAVVRDRSGMVPALDLAIRDAANVQWLPGGGIRIGAATLIATRAPASRITRACKMSGALTVEAVFAPATDEQEGPARIVSLSADPKNCNFTLGQELSRIDFRMRTTRTSTVGIPGLPSGKRLLRSRGRVHVVCTFDGEMKRMYVNGSEDRRLPAKGDVSNWADFGLAIGNEFTGDRPWLGDVLKVAVYSRALEADEIVRHFEGISSATGSPDSHIVGQWSFDEPAGAVARDSSRNANHCRIVGGAKRVKGLSGGAISLNGTDAWAIADAPKGLPTGSAPRTILAWFKTAQWGRYNNVGGFGINEVGRNFQLCFVKSRPCLMGWSERRDWPTGVSAKPYADGGWHCVAATYDGIAARVYLDGEPKAATTRYVFDTDPRKVVIGNEIDEKGHEFVGDIDEFRIYDVALTAMQIRQIAESGPKASAASSAAPARPARTTDPVPKTPVAPPAETPATPAMTPPSNAAALATALGDFEGFVRKGQYAGAKTYAVSAAKDAASAGSAADLLAAARAAGALEERRAAMMKRMTGLADTTVTLKTRGGLRKGTLKSVTDAGLTLVTTYRIGTRTGETKHEIAWLELTWHQQEKLAEDWLGAGADADAGRALLAHSLGAADQSARLLAAAGDHAVARYLRRKAAVERLGTAEVAAKEAWLALAPLSGRPGLSEEKAKRLAAALADYTLRHGGTAYAKSVADDVADMRQRLELASGAATTKGLVARWTFDEGKGEAARDATGRGMDAAVSGAEWAPGKVGGALSFNGESARATVAAEGGSVFGTLESFTIAAWIRPRNAESYQGIVSARHGSEEDYGQGNFVMQLRGGLVGFEAADLFRGNDWTARVPVVGEWHHAAVVVHHGDRAEIFIDGKLATTKDGIREWTFSDQDGVVLGCRFYSKVYRAYFSGSIDDIRVYNRALGAGEVAAIAGATQAAVPRPAPEPTVEQGEPDPVDDGAPVVEDDVPWPPKVSAVQRLFKGRVRSFNNKSLYISLAYDFQSPGQVDDFARDDYARAAKAGKTDRDVKPDLAGGRLFMRHKRERLLHRAVFTNARISAEARFDNQTGEASQTVELLLGANEAGDRYGLVTSQRITGLRKVAGGEVTVLEKGNVTALGKGAWAPVTFGFARGRLAANVKGMRFDAADVGAPLAPGRVGMSISRGRAEFDNLLIAGVLDEAWLRRALARQGTD